MVQRLKKVLPWLGTGLSILLLALLIQKLNLTKVAVVLQQANFLYLLPEVLLLIGGYLLRLYRWKVILLARKSIALQELAGPFIIGFALNTIIPARLGEFLRAYLISKKHGLPVSLVLGTVLVERLADILTLLFFLIGGVFVLPQLASFQKTLWLLGGFVTVGVLFIGLLWIFTSSLSAWAMRLPQIGPVLGRFMEQIRFFLSGFGALGKLPFLSAISALSIGAWLMPVFALHFLLLCFHISLAPLGTAFILAATNLGLAVPAAPGGIGTFQAITVSLLHLFHVSSDTAFGLALVWNSVELLLMTPLGFLLLWWQGLSLRNLPAAEPTIQQETDRIALLAS